MSEEKKKVIPHDADAELAILSSIFIDNAVLEDAAEILSADDFYIESHKVVFEVCRELYSRGSPIDIITVKNALTEKGVFEKFGGISFIAHVASAAGNSVNVKKYAEIVKNKSLLRRLIKISEDVKLQCYEEKNDTDTIISFAENEYFSVSGMNSVSEGHQLKDIIGEVFANIEENYRKKGKLTGVPTGFIDFDSKTAGLQKSDLILIAARPSMGKTAFALNIAHHAAVKENATVAIFSLEMSEEQLFNRLISAEARIDAQKFRNGELEDSDWRKLMSALAALSAAEIYIFDRPGASPLDIKTRCKKLKKEKALDLILIDYLQLMSADGKKESRQQEITSITRELKAIAKELKVPVVVLSQLSRACEQRSDHRPILSDLRESGAIEQDADVVAFLYRDEYYFPNTEVKNQAELIIAKQRNGPTGIVNLVWLGQYTKFSNINRRV